MERSDYRKYVCTSLAQTSREKSREKNFKARKRSGKKLKARKNLKGEKKQSRKKLNARKKSRKTLKGEKKVASNSSDFFEIFSARNNLLRE